MLKTDSLNVEVPIVKKPEDNNEFELLPKILFGLVKNFFFFFYYCAVSIFCLFRRVLFISEEDDCKGVDSAERVREGKLNKIDLQVDDIFDRLAMLYRRLQEDIDVWQSPAMRLPNRLHFLKM